MGDEHMDLYRLAHTPLLKDLEPGYLKFSATWAAMCTKKEGQLLRTYLLLHRVVRNNSLEDSWAKVERGREQFS